MLTKTDIAELLELAEWLEAQPAKCAFSGKSRHTCGGGQIRLWEKSDRTLRLFTINRATDGG